MSGRWKALETRLHAIAEEFTQGRYGTRSQPVDTEALTSDVVDAIDMYYCDEDNDDEDDDESAV